MEFQESGEWKWESEPEIQFKLNPLHFQATMFEEEGINYFFEDPSFVNF